MRRGSTGIAGAFADVTNDYRVARSTKLRSGMRGLAAGGASADWEFRNENDYYRILAMARFLDQNNTLVGQGVNRYCDLVFKSGLKYDAATGDDDLDIYIKSRWMDWATDPRQCDAQGRLTFDQMAKLVHRHVVVDGDHIVIPTQDGNLQCIEGHRLVTPTNASKRKSAVHCGVRRDAVGRPIEYWLTIKDSGIHARVEKVEDIIKIPAVDNQGNQQVLHIFMPERVSQTRGVSSFVRLFENAMAHDDLQWAMLIKEQAAACVTFFREVEAGVKLPMGGTAAFGGISTETNYDGTTRTVHDIAPGLEIQGRPGEKLQGFSPNLPGDGFVNHSEQIIKFISVNLGLPSMALTLDATQTNFSAYRGAMDMAKSGFAANRDWMKTQFYVPVYKWWLRGEIAKDPLLQEAARRTDINIFGHQFKNPLDQYIDPSKDAKADADIIANGMDSSRNILSYRGLDIDEVMPDQVNDEFAKNCLAAEAARKANLKFPEANFTWQDFIPRGAVQGSPPAQAAPAGDKPADAPAQDPNTDPTEDPVDA